MGKSKSDDKHAAQMKRSASSRRRKSRKAPQFVQPQIPVRQAPAEEKPPIEAKQHEPLMPPAAEAASSRMDYNRPAAPEHTAYGIHQAVSSQGYEPAPEYTASDSSRIAAEAPFPDSFSLDTGYAPSAFSIQEQLQEAPYEPAYEPAAIPSFEERFHGLQEAAEPVPAVSAPTVTSDDYDPFAVQPEEAGDGILEYEEAYGYDGTPDPYSTWEPNGIEEPAEPAVLAYPESDESDHGADAFEQQLFIVPPEQDAYGESDEEETYAPSDAGFAGRDAAPDPMPPRDFVPVFESAPFQQHPSQPQREQQPQQSGWLATEEQQHALNRGSRRRKSQPELSEKKAEETFPAAVHEGDAVSATAAVADGLGQSIGRLRDQIRSIGLRNTIYWFIMSLHEHKIPLLIVSAIMLAIGMIANRYITIGYGLILVLIGAFVSSKDENADPFILYCLGLAVAFVPFLF